MKKQRGFGTEHAITYCGCGSPTAITRGSNTSAPETTTLAYNYHGAITRVGLPNGTSFTNRYDLIGRLQIREDALTRVTNTFDNLGRVIARRNAAGLLDGLGYDLRDRVLKATNANAVLITNQWDVLSRPLVGGYPDGGKERWAYTLGFAGATRLQLAACSGCPTSRAVYSGWNSALHRNTGSA